MVSSNSTQAATAQLAAQADVIGRLARDSGGFAAVAAAFEAADADAFRWALERLELSRDCELICEWLRIKFCVIRCLEVCGPLRPDYEVPSLEYFARAVVALAADEKRLRRVVDAVACGSPEEYHAVLAELDLQRFCHLICRWICAISYRRICEVLCSPGPVLLTDPAADVRAAAKVLERAIAHGKVLHVLGEAVLDLDCLRVQSLLDEANLVGDCEILCLVFCIWRNTWVCRELCVRPTPIVSRAMAIEEARAFALAARVLASQPRAVGDLVGAVEARNAKAYAAIVDRFGLGEYCLQLCGWVSSLVCFEFCFCVCVPPSGVVPLFTHVGSYKVEPSPNDFNANGTTVAGDLAFTLTIPLIGLLPDGTAPKAIEYRFTYQDFSGVSPNPNPVIPVTGPMVPPTSIGSVEYQFWDGTAWVFASADFWVNNAGATLTIPQEFGPALTVNVNSPTDADGWIQIPQLASNAQGATGLFVPGGTLVDLDTTQLSSESFDLTGAGSLPALVAGDTMPPGTLATVPKGSLSEKPIFQINFEAREVVSLTPVGGNSLNAIAISNTTYSYIRHPDWPGSPPPPPTTVLPLVLSVDILELKTAGGCTRLDDTIHVLYTAYHPYLGSCDAVLLGPGVTTMTTPPGGVLTLPIQPNQGQVLGVGDGATTTFLGTLTTPVLPSSLLVTAAGASGSDNAGAISGTGVASGSVNYGTGAVSVTFSTAPASGVQVLATFDTNVASGPAGSPFDMTGLPPCGYLLELNATLNLTQGYGGVFGTFTDLIPFCTISPA
jgi:hypothetical protein